MTDDTSKKKPTGNIKMDQKILEQVVRRALTDGEFAQLLRDDPPKALANLKSKVKITPEMERAFQKLPTKSLKEIFEVFEDTFCTC